MLRRTARREAASEAARTPADRRRRLHLSRTVGHGRRDLDAAARAVLSWQAQRLLAVHVEPPDAPVRPGTEVEIRLGLGRLALSAPARVTEIVDQPDRQGFTYRTLPGHPLCGEEAFVVNLEPGGRVRFTVSASSRPASALTRLAGPLLPLFQRFMAGRYARSVQRAVRRTR